ncbi:Histidine kinase [Flaviramulus basaltis]|uniref:Histidine kinase n=1 Tax=Flaviramulus basaltis TaxID=369401 RepID=A0A1K2IIX5_9FLAO|nr:histidine kinase [Flaviramulus basaltis]SFZ92226.1 Histidine kinase [Flaviramulus basaltis]
MKNFPIKKGLLISLVVSCLTTSPRVIRLSATDFSYLLSHLFYLFVLSFVYWSLTQVFLHQKKNIVLKIILYLFISGLISILYHFSVKFFFNDYAFFFSDLPIIEELKGNHIRLLLFVRGVLFSAIIYFIVYYLNLLEDKQKALLEIEQLKQEKLEAQLDTLKQQISPHFLFNSLSTLKTIVAEETSKEYIIQLSNVYRYLLSYNELHLTTLEEELEFVNSYLYIQKERFEDALIISIIIEDTFLEKQIPPLVLQLLIENSIKHNIVSLDDPLLIKVFIEGENTLVVSNNLQPKMTTETTTKKGLENIRNRYLILSGKNIEVIKSKDNFIVKVPLLD